MGLYRPMQTQPCRIGALCGRGVTYLAAGTHSFAVCGDFDEVVAFGSNTWGQLGLGHAIWQASPQVVPALCRIRVTRIACGFAHTVVLTAEDEVLAFGRNDAGQLGLGDEQDRSEPVRVETVCGAGVRQLDCGASHTVFLTNADEVLAVGCNATGRVRGR